MGFREQNRDFKTREGKKPTPGVHIPTDWYHNHNMARPPNTPGPGDARSRLLDAALKLFRAKGYTATTVDDLCREAGVSKGAFFHHFANKEAAALAAIAYWDETTGSFFEAARFWEKCDPRDRLLAYIELRRRMAAGELAEFTCLLGTLVQETYERHPAIRKACDRGIRAHAGTLVETIQEAKARYAPRARWSAEGLALHIQTVLQGAFVLSKASGNAEPIEEALAHLRRYVEQLLPATPAGKRPAKELSAKNRVAPKELAKSKASSRRRSAKKAAEKKPSRPRSERASRDAKTGNRAMKTRTSSREEKRR